VKDNFSWGFDQLFVKDGLVPAFPDSPADRRKAKVVDMFSVGKIFIYLDLVLHDVSRDAPGPKTTPHNPPHTFHYGALKEKVFPCFNL
jgi:hypothetical protein